MADELKKDAISEVRSSSSNNGAKDGGSPPLEEVMAENKRKAEELKSVKAELESSKARLDELEEKDRLTAAERQEKVELETDVKLEAKRLRTLKETQPWIEVAKEEAEKAGETKAFDVLLNNELERANDFIDDRAAERGETPKELARKMQSYAMRYTDKRPSRRNELAYRDLVADESKSKSLDDREKALKEKEDAETKYREGAGRHVRDASFDQKIEGASKKDAIRLMREQVQTQKEAV